MNDQPQDNTALAALLVPDSAAEFVRRFYQNVPEEDIAQRDPLSLAACALSLWEFAQTRPPGAAILRLLPTLLDGRPILDRRVVVEIVNDDMPFLVDTVTATLSALGLTVRLIIHPVVPVARDASGERTQNASGPAKPESMMRVELSGRMTEARGQAVVRRLGDVLQDVRVVVGDWPAIRGRVLQMAADLGGPTSPSPFRAEAAAFLHWISDDNFVFLGFREYGFTTDGLFLTAGTGLGLLRDEAFLVFDGLRDLSARSAEVKAFLTAPAPMVLSKSLRRSTVHRLLPMDTIGVKLFSETGAVIGLRLVIGLFTRASYFRPPASVPMLRQKLRRCLDRAGFAADSHDGRALSRILAAFPRDELLHIDEGPLYQTAIGLLHLEQRPRIALFVLRDPFERFVTCLVYLPAERYNSEVRARMAAILAAAFGGAVMSDSTRFDESPLARIHFMIATIPGQVVAPNIAALEQDLVEAGRIWSDRLADALSRLRDETTAEMLQRRFAEAFPAAYTARFTAAQAVADIALVVQVEAGVALAVRLDLVEQGGPDGGALRLKTCQAGTPTALSDMLPLLENLGVRVLNEIPFEISPREGGVVWLQEFSLQPRDGIPPAEALPLFERALRMVWAGDVENDGLHRLVLSAGLDIQQLVILRAYSKIFRQTGTLFSQPTIEVTLAAHPKLARNLVALFEAQFDPESADETRAAAIAAEIEAALETVSNLDEDRILRSFLLLIRASLRTNHYRLGRSYLSIKLASHELDLLPLPRPLVEIHVYSPRMEGCHLRGGRVARGGIRWSDRREDFRTEILGLMKAQMVKNAVIVPVGSKGGFIVKRPPPQGSHRWRSLLMEEVVACYQTLIRGMLDLTDNIVGADIIPPPDVVRRDGDDPYLVVAADKGTATFSDIANALALEYGFWLGDAFASGGSVGYDHKAMGITARGAWEAVKRHFRELGRDIQTAPFTCIGIGDMSGDVFGNGMLLSRQTRLLAAFNHMHIFIDPDPDPAVSWAERARLFALPGSTWADYGAEALSQGGAVFARSAKTITLSPQAQAVFALSQPQLTPTELISHLLCAAVDLLWFGGIGTYVKASTETQADAGDRVNDALRADANSLRALVVGEGANLGVTQRGRIEFALGGGRINTDAIDNSAGVDTSDHEVNIKIGVGAMIDAGVLTQGQRAAFLASLSDDVAGHVLVDNVLQTQALSLAVAEGGEALERHARLMRALEREQRLNRAVEFLPDDKALTQRAMAKAGLSRPELAVLMAYAKNAIHDALLDNEILDHPDLDAELLQYFPPAMQQKVILRHRLRREIIATSLANALVNRMGISFVADIVEVTGAQMADIARAFLIVREVFALPACWAAIEALDNVAPASTQLALLQEVTVAAEQAVRWFLTSGIALDIAARRQEFATGFTALAAGLAPTTRNWDGVPDALAAQITGLAQLVTCMDIVQIAEASGIGVTEVGELYFAVGEALGLVALRSQARNLPGGTPWARIARDTLVQDSYTMQRRLAQNVVSQGADLVQWRARRALEIGQIDMLLTEMLTAHTPDLALLGVVARRIAALA